VNDRHVDKAFISSSWEIERGYIRHLPVPDFIKLDQRGMLEAVWLTHAERQAAARRNATLIEAGAPAAILNGSRPRR
jgi:hypothetical protein